MTRPNCWPWPKAARAAHADLFVLDDGWFKGRDSDTTSLGDWTADRRKLPGGVAGLCRKINALGLDFGIWVEPEAVSPDSDLYRAHPDWALHIPGRPTLEIRHQYTLDFSRADVRENIWQQLCALLDSCPIRYVKWDMNRSLANVYSAALPAARQGEVYHRYVLGVYELQQKLTGRYPDLLLENCAGGGARFDCGMLYYSPQIWTSDNTDALDRQSIQYGTSFCYPPCAMGAHYSTVPNHITGRTASVEARMAAALTGTFGFELDLTAYTDAEIKALHPYVQFYRDHGALLRGGDLYRLAAPGRPRRGLGHRRGGRQRGGGVCGRPRAGRAAACRCPLPGPASAMRCTRRTPAAMPTMPPTAMRWRPWACRCQTCAATCRGISATSKRRADSMEYLRAVNFAPFSRRGAAGHRRRPLYVYLLHAAADRRKRRYFVPRRGAGRPLCRRHRLCRGTHHRRRGAAGPDPLCPLDRAAGVLETHRQLPGRHWRARIDFLTTRSLARPAGATGSPPTRPSSCTLRPWPPGRRWNA